MGIGGGETIQSKLMLDIHRAETTNKKRFTLNPLVAQVDHEHLNLNKHSTISTNLSEFNVC